MKAIPEVKDSYNFTIGAFYLIGVLVFLPMQFFSTSTDYWMYKFRPAPPPDDGHRPCPPHFTTGSSNDYDIPTDRNFYQAHITASLSYTQIISMTISLVLLILFKHRLPSPQARIKTSLVTSFIFYIIITLFTIFTPDDNLILYFAVVILLAIVMNLSSALTIMSLYELVTKFPISYYAAITSGQVISGVLSSLIQIITLSLRISPTASGGVYFGVGSMMIAGTTVIYWFNQKNSKYFIYRIGQKEVVTEPATKIWPTKDDLCAAFKKLKWIYGTFITINASSALIYPGFVVLISPMEKHNGRASEWEQFYFVPVITFLGCQFCNFLGRESARIFRIPKNGSYIMIVAVLRIGLVPLLLFCNAQPRKHLPVIFGDDAYIVIIFFFGFTEGLLVNLSFIAIPTVVSGKELEIAVVLVPLLNFFFLLIFGSLNFIFITII